MRDEHGRDVSLPPLFQQAQQPATASPPASSSSSSPSLADGTKNCPAPKGGSVPQDAGGVPATSPKATRHTSLDPLESTVNLTPNPVLRCEAPPLTFGQQFIHSGWAGLRNRIFRGLTSTSRPDSRIKAFAECCNACYIIQNADDASQFAFKANRCHDRLCLPCARLKSFKIQEALKKQIGQVAPLFITLTLSGKDACLRDLINRLYKHFRALRLHPVWADAVEGGAAMLEIKWNAKAQRWHPHLHIVCHGKYMPQHRLSDAWRSITRDSFIVDVQRVSSLENCLTYVTKYASKPFDGSIMHDQDALEQMIIAIAGRRLCLTFGTWYGTPLTTAEDEELDEADWTRDPFRALQFCTFNELAISLAQHDPAGIEVARLLNLRILRDSTSPPG